ncbi:hypothetical protein Q4F19_20730 [Sphingomonas sp. BIUV-7]|uniref:Uncharacterized protein n=1 Tax=Sphingomonas natans TaxID=3063330 RepID=A0ABT8YEL7_9SPHN|nr:hypothetical protein [Sphingomonas sp. BIUV-7]MDO6416821.1 hypothetical protein [Sphingomonas sp. BIUV-7]
MKMFPPIAPQPEPDIRLIDNTFAPEILATGMSGLSLMNGVVTITFESLHCDHSKSPPPMERVVVARLTTPVAAAQALLVGLHQFLGQHGLSPLTQPTETCQ